MFDKTHPYALVYGHPKAKFEQLGRLYDAAGNHVPSGHTLTIHHTKARQSNKIHAPTNE